MKFFWFGPLPAMTSGFTIKPKVYGPSLRSAVYRRPIPPPYTKLNSTCTFWPSFHLLNNYQLAIQDKGLACDSQFSVKFGVLNTTEMSLLSHHLSPDFSKQNFNMIEPLINMLVKTAHKGSNKMRVMNQTSNSLIHDYHEP